MAIARQEASQERLDDKLKDLEMSQEDYQGFMQRGYEPLRKLGEGNTRPAYLLRYTSGEQGEVSKLRVGKPSKKEVDPNSPTTKINRSKGDLDLREINISNQIHHPYIAETIDSFLMDGRRVNIEDYYEGVDLETLVKTAGPLTSERFTTITNQLIEALSYLHEDKRILHRDIKPSNIIVTRDGNIKLTDLQTAARIEDIHENSMMTKGGTPYAHIYLTNAIATGKAAMATETTDVYSLGGTLYFALTGEEPTPYALVPCENGRLVELENESFKLSLKNQETGQIMERIDLNTHKKLISNKLKKVPKKYRKLFQRVLSTDPENKPIHSTYQLKEEFKNTSSDFRERVSDAVQKGIRVAIPTLAAGLIAGLTAIAATYNWNNRGENVNSISMFNRQDYRDFSLDSVNGTEEELMYKVLGPGVSGIERELENLDEETERDINHYINFAENVHLMDRRLASAVIKAGYISEGVERVYEKNNEERLFPSFVPERFAQKYSMSIDNSLGMNPRPIDHKDEAPIIGYGIKYLQLCLGPGKDVSDVLAEYYSTNQDINIARIKSESINYFPRVDENGHTVHKGYGTELPPYQQGLIDTALTLYLITGNDGEIDPLKVQKFDLYKFPTSLITPNYQTRTH